MENIKGIFRLHLIDTRTSYLMFWSIFTVVSLALIVLFHNAAREGNLHIGIGIAVIIYLGVHALISIKETLPYAIGLGYTRRQYALASILFLTLLAVFTAAFQHIYVLIVEGIASQIGVGGELFLSYENFFPQE